MWNVFSRLKLVAFGLGVFAAGSVVDASTLSLKAAKRIRGGVTTTYSPAVSSLNDVLPGDTIEAEIFLSDWAADLPDGVRTFQVKIDGAGLVSPDNGTALPKGWCAPVNLIACTDSTTCPSTYPNCSGTLGCTCSPYDPNLGAVITPSRTDYLFFPVSEWQPFAQIDTSTLSFRYSGIASKLGVPDTLVPRYLGTLTLIVSSNACGTFTINSVKEYETTFIAGPDQIQLGVTDFQPLQLTIADCARQLLSCGPNHCNIDARFAHDPLVCASRKNTDRIQMTYSKSVVGNCSTDPFQTCTLNSQCTQPGTCTGALDLEVTILPVVGIESRTVSSITADAVDPKIATVALNQRILQTRWTCIRDKGSNKRCCMGSLPADVDGNQKSQLGDSLAIWRNLDGQTNPKLPIERCDSDRSEECTPADVLMVVDMLTGADCFESDTPPTPGVNTDSLPDFYTGSGLLIYNCPNMNLPP